MDLQCCNIVKFTKPLFIQISIIHVNVLYEQKLGCRLNQLFLNS